MVGFTTDPFSLPRVARPEQSSLLARSRSVLHVRAKSHDTVQDKLPTRPVEGEGPVPVLQTPRLFLGDVLADRF